MNKRSYFFGVLLGISLLTLVFAFIPKTDKNTDSLILTLIKEGLNSMHFEPKEFNDELSAKIFDLYLKRLDGNKKFLLQTDYDQLKKFRLQLDDQIKAGSTAFFDESYSILIKRRKEAAVYYQKALEKPFDLQKNEIIELDPDKVSYAKNAKELADAWHLAMKYQVINRIYDAERQAEEAKKNNDTSFVFKSFENLEADAREKVLKNQNDWFKRMDKSDKKEWFSIYINSITNVFDPHTVFFPPKDKENFDINMTGQLEGIGATLQEADGYIKIVSLVVGGPAWLQGDLKEGDLILKVKQETGDPVDIIDMRVDNAVKLIRGKKGTKVTLSVKKNTGTTQNITITRDIVQIEESFAKSAVIKAPNKKEYGYIYLPQFYADINRSGSRSCADDVAKEIKKLKEEKVKGIILDLRNNGGGSLQDVVRMAGHFIDKGPIVQVKGRRGSANVLEDYTAGTIYDDALIIMVNHYSASASEIMAAAMQDYKRAVIVGASSTFGKGTVQQFMNLDDVIRGNDELKPLGSLKITFQKFYRINGGSNQLKGVVPDIILPDMLNRVKSGERDEEFPLAYSEIEKAIYKPTQAIGNLEALRKKSEARVKNQAIFSLVEESSKRIKAQRDKTQMPTAYTSFQNELKKREQENETLKNAAKPIDQMQLRLAVPDLMKTESDSVFAKKNSAWFKDLQKDAYLFEALNILQDMGS